MTAGSSAAEGASANPSLRLRAALAAGTDPTSVPLEALVTRCAIEPDFFVRDMLTWALTRHPAAEVVPRLLEELGSPLPQARSQALHTLSKIGDPTAWPAVSRSLHDPDDTVAASAWRAAVSLVPDDRRSDLAAALSSELGRGEPELQRSLSRAMAALGDAAVPALAAGAARGSAAARTHAKATQRLLADPELDFTTALDEAKRQAILGRGPIPGTSC